MLLNIPFWSTNCYEISNFVFLTAIVIKQLKKCIKVGVNADVTGISNDHLQLYYCIIQIYVYIYIYIYIQQSSGPGGANSL